MDKKDNTVKFKGLLDEDFNNDEYRKAKETFVGLSNSLFDKHDGLTQEYLDELDAEAKKLLGAHKDSKEWAQAWKDFSEVDESLEEDVEDNKSYIVSNDIPYIEKGGMSQEKQNALVDEAADCLTEDNEWYYIPKNALLKSLGFDDYINKYIFDINGLGVVYLSKDETSSLQLQESLTEDAEDIDVEAEVEVEEPKEDAKEPKLETFEEKIDFLIGDEDEAIAGYDKIIAMLGDGDANATAIEQLTHIKEEEVAHKDFLEVLKKDPSAIYNHEDKEEEPKENDDDKIEVSNAEFIDDISLKDIDDDFGESISESTDFDDDFGFNHIIDESEDDVKLGTVDWSDLDDEDDVLFKKVIKNTDEDILDKHFGKDTPERKLVGAVKDMKEDSHNTGHIKAKKPIELKARVEK